MLADSGTKFRLFIEQLHARLNIPSSYAESLKLVLCEEPSKLVNIGLDVYGRSQWLEPQAAIRLNKLLAHASNDGVEIGFASAFRNVQYQALLFEKKLSAGMSISAILKTNAAPGYSEHHLGVAVDLVDLVTHPETTLCESFEQTASYIWLKEHAEAYQFTLSYDRNNQYGVMYEPWHWKFSNACVY